MPRRLKVTMIHPDLGIGGAERLVLDVAVALASHGNKVNFVTNHFDKHHTFEELQSAKFPVRVIGDWIPRGVYGICQAMFAYMRMIYLSLVYVVFTSKNDIPDIYFVDQIPMAVPFIKCTGRKVIYYCHHPDLLASPEGGFFKRLYRMPIDWLELKGTEMADVILVNSGYTASVFRNTFPQIKKDVQILYPTIAESYQTMIQSKTCLGDIHELVPDIPLRKDNFTFLSINRFHPAKKLELAIEAFEVLKSRLSHSDWEKVHLIMAGGYDPQSTINAIYYDQLVNLAKEKELSNKIIFLKSPSDYWKAELLLCCNCLVYTPVNEHFGIVPLEAMSAGKPVIACNSGGPCETIDNGVTGLLCNPTADSLGECMQKVMDTSISNSMGSLGRKRLEKQFSYNTFVSCVNNIFINTMAATKGQPIPSTSSGGGDKACHVSNGVEGKISKTGASSSNAGGDI